MSTPDAHGWMPIDSAPKDGTKIDLMFPTPRGRTIDCFWGRSHLVGSDLWIWRTTTWERGEILPENEWTVHCYPNLHPTHWRPVPLPPVPTEDRK